MPTSRLRTWLLYVAVTGAIGVAAFLCLRSIATGANPMPGAIGRALTILAAPGLTLDFVVGTHLPGILDQLFNWGLIALGSGLVWGSMLFGVRAIVLRAQSTFD